MRIAYLTGRSYRGEAMGPGQLPAQEALSYPILAAAAERQGITFELAYWDAADLASRGFDAAIIRSCWDYHERPEVFVATLREHERRGLRVFNNSEIVAWNARKTYLRDLGASAIETIWAEDADAHAVAKAFDALDAAEIVLKPQIGAGSRETIRLKRNGWSEADLIAGPRGPAMIQPYLSAIETEGERSLFWFGGDFGHAIRKIPAAGDWLANMPGRTRFVAEAPPPAARDAAEAARALSPAELMYVRIDLVLGDDERWRVIEIEAIEPYLFFDFAPEGAEVFAAALRRVLSL